MSKRRRNYPKYCAKTLRYFAYRDKGLTRREAYKIATGKEKITIQGLCTIERKYKSWSLERLKNPEVVKSAYEAIRETLKMKPINVETTKPDGETVIETIVPTITNRLVAAKMVMDRVEPAVKRNVSLSINADFSPVDLEKYRNR